MDVEGEGPNMVKSFELVRLGELLDFELGHRANVSLAEYEKVQKPLRSAVR